MNQLNKISLAIIAGVAIAASYTTSCSANNNETVQKQTVTVHAKRMSDAEKLTFDREAAASGVQTVVISAKRLSPQAKVAFDRNNAAKLNQA